MGKKIYNIETQEVEAVHDKPAMEPMTVSENIESIFTLIRMLYLEYQKLEVFHWFDAQQVQNDFGLKSTINALYMAMTHMQNTANENERRNIKQNWMT